MTKTKTEADLTWAATARCPCGAGLAYDESCQSEGPMKWPYNGYWDCSDILLDRAKPAPAVHTGTLPFAYYEIKSAGQPSANGATTRPN